MTEDIKPEVIKKTQDALGKFIKKPVLAEKLLRKPPFRFLHDICTAAMRETGFFEGILNSADSKAENIKDKDGKIAFLVKVIAAVESASGVKLNVKPSKIVAGHEPTKTNEFLQALAKALEKQVENGHSTKESKSKAKTSKRPIKEETPNKKKTPVTKQKTQKPTENGTNAKPTKVQPQTITEVDSSPTKNSRKKSIKISPPNGEENGSVRTDFANQEIGQNGYGGDDGEETPHRPDKETKSSKSRRKLPEAEESVDSQVPETEDSPPLPAEGMTNGAGENHKENSNQSRDQQEVKRPHSARPGHRKSSAQQNVERTRTSEIVANGHDEAPNLQQTQGSSSSDNVLRDKIDSVNRSESVLGDRVKSTPSPPELPSQQPSQKEENAVSRPRTGIRPATSRPASARPAAPRIRDRGEVAIQEEVIKPASSGQVKVIVDKNRGDDPDEENLVELEVTGDDRLDEVVAEVPSPSATGFARPDHTEHGHLVEQILETQKELEGPFREKKAGKIEIEWESNRNRESTNREVEKLRGSIQTLTRSANPLGKLLDFLQEDVDTMQRELESWKETNASLSVQIHQEKSLTEQSIEPLRVHLKELQQSIDQQLEQISVVKANIIRNDQKIIKLLNGNN